MKPQDRLLFSPSGLGLLVALVLLGCATPVSPAQEPPPLVFERLKWLRHPEYNSQNTVRSRMEDDLKFRYLRPGIAAKEVEKLIGKPESKEEPSALEGVESCPNGSTAWVYPVSNFDDEDTPMTILMVIVFDRKNTLLKVCEGYIA